MTRCYICEVVKFYDEQMRSELTDDETVAVVRWLERKSGEGERAECG